jgi:DNA-binding response OmpR family regulator
MHKERILVVEDEEDILELVRYNLAREGYDITCTTSGEMALEIFRNKTPDLVVLDLMLPKVDGFEVARWLRSRGDTPIIMLTARREEQDRIAGLEMGADDYVVKPFSPQELVSRVRAVLRRTRAAMAPASQERPVVVGDLRVDPGTRLATVRGEEKALSAREFDLLWLLVRHPRQVFSRDRLLEEVWGLTEYIDPSTVTVHIRHLREKIEVDPSNPHHILTVWGVGYKFEP